MLNWLSIRTPRSETVVEKLTLAESSCSSVTVSLSSCCLVLSHTSYASLMPTQSCCKINLLLAKLSSTLNPRNRLPLACYYGSVFIWFRLLLRLPDSNAANCDSSLLDALVYTHALTCILTVRLRMRTLGLSVDICLSVRPSVCPSVKRVDCDKTK